MIMTQKRTACLVAFLMISCTMTFVTVLSAGNADAAVPGVPTGVAATYGYSYVHLTWQAPANNTHVTSYLIYRSSGSSAQVQVGNSAELSYNDTSVSNGVTYSYSVKAVDGQNQSYLSNMISVTPGSVPFTPIGFSGSIGDKHADLSWTAPNNGGFQISSYKLYRSNATGSFVLISNNTQSSYTDSGLVNGKQYMYKVSAVNQLGEGPKSLTVTLTPMTMPSVPGGLRSSIGDAQATLAWDAPLDNGGGAVLSYNVYESVSGSTMSYVANTTETGYRIIDLVNGYQYQFTVAAVNAVGEGARSLPVTSAVSDVPSIVTNLQAYPGVNNATITWNMPGNNGGSPVIQYAIYRSSSLTGIIPWSG